MLNVNGQIVHLYAEARVLVADESALHATMLNKAASGLIPCFLCADCCGHKAEIHQHSQIHVPNTEVDINKFVLHTHGSIYKLVDELANARLLMTDTDLAAFEMRIGLNSRPEGFVRCARAEYHCVHM